VKRGAASILDGDNNPLVLLHHFVVASVHAVKVYGQYGAVLRYETACKIINYGLVVNKVVVPNKKLGGQHLHLMQRDMLQSLVENLCESFAGDNSKRHYPGKWCCSSCDNFGWNGKWRSSSCLHRWC
jgi:hypothetical protein